MGYTRFSTGKANYHLEYGVHVKTTEFKDIDKMDVLIILGSSYLGVLTYFSSLKFFK